VNVQYSSTVYWITAVVKFSTWYCIFVITIFQFRNRSSYHGASPYRSKWIYIFKNIHINFRALYLQRYLAYIYRNVILSLVINTYYTKFNSIRAPDLLARIYLILSVSAVLVNFFFCWEFPASITSTNILFGNVDTF
jgi:hypothetical protein